MSDQCPTCRGNGWMYDSNLTPDERRPASEGGAEGWVCSTCDGTGYVDAVMTNEEAIAPIFNHLIAREGHYKP